VKDRKRTNKITIAIEQTSIIDKCLNRLFLNYGKEKGERRK
jgi:hypothetical protein